METESTLIESGINLLLTGMIVVFFFLLALIISIYLLRLLFSESSNLSTPAVSNSSVNGSIDKIHERIIHEIMEHHQS
ncbi:OadG family protein [Gammaproteobacteria bacterium]|nr:OadG family protein [Gammaproteobacteria bacterium]